MRRAELQNVLQARPFRPIRLFLTDDTTIDIPHPDLCFLLHRTAIIGYPAEGAEGDEGDRFNVVDLVHVTRLDSSGTPNLAETRGEE